MEDNTKLPLPAPTRTPAEPPFSYRIAKGDNHIRDFLNQLMEKYKTRQAVIHHCIETTMKGGAPAIDNKEVENLRIQVEELRKEKARLETRNFKLEQLASRNPEPIITGYTPEGAVAEQLEVVRKKKSLTNPIDAIKFCINYTNRNLW